ncbi:hypothetical protein OKC48_23780 [Methylorubrum extorquens]|uniref:DUF6634 family protein n=1 Tax=Methylorubrum extorquens TaxID=408 RepID=UPI002238E48E|nr:DUF6634 family protein [Methylorubrum extorquens]UYW26253.1 hypothetical protein OKC48_23780 [Methylorubrum extorquens]
MRFRRQSLAEIARLNRQRDEDLARLDAGWEPTAEDLAGAPTLSYWIAYTPPGEGEPMLMGHLKGHPRQLDGWTQTEQVLRRGEGWARLHHSWLRLGEPMPPRPHMEPRDHVPAQEPAGHVDDGALDHLPDYSQPGPWGR